MISHEKKIVFVHIPKTGGKRLSEFLLPYCDEESLQFSPFVENGNLHATVSEYVQYYGHERLKDYKFFCIVRNPFERVVSMHFHQNNNIFDREKFHKLVFDPQAVGAWPHSHFHFMLNPGAQETLVRTFGGDPDHDIVLGYPPQPTEEHTTYLLNSIWPMEKIRFENYASEVSEWLACHEIMHDPSQLFVKSNTTNHRHYSHYFQLDEIREIQYMCGLDLQTMNYGFERVGGSQ